MNISLNNRISPTLNLKHQKEASPPFSHQIQVSLLKAQFTPHRLQEASPRPWLELPNAAAPSGLSLNRLQLLPGSKLPASSVGASDPWPGSLVRTEWETFPSHCLDLRGDTCRIVKEVAENADFLEVPPSLEAAWLQGCSLDLGLVYLLFGWDTTGQSLVFVGLTGKPVQASVR